MYLGAQVQIAHDNRNLNAGDEEDGKDDGQKPEHIVEAVLPVPCPVWLPSNRLRQAAATRKNKKHVSSQYVVEAVLPDGRLGRKTKRGVAVLDTYQQR